MNVILESLNNDGYFIYDENEEDLKYLSEFILKYIHEAPSMLGDSKVRRGVDQGMVEIKIDWAKFPTKLAKIGERYEKEFSLILDRASLKSTGIVSKIYFNSNIYSTRGFHTDGQRKQYKMFTYLTDCQLKDGPYTLVPGSHKWSISKSVSFWWNKLFRRTIDANTYIFDAEPDCIKITGEMGTRFISDQNALHRGAPQTENGKRVAWVIDSACD